MTRPEDAVEQARASAEEMRAAGAYTEDSGRAPAEPEPLSSGKLIEWAMIEPDLREVRSTRAWGAPVTALKRLLVRLLAQYHAELVSQQTRFNVNLLARLRRLEERVAELEAREAGEHGDDRPA